MGLGIMKKYICKLENNTGEFINRKHINRNIKKGEINKQHGEEPNITISKVEI